jgi:hypothetical protein
MPLRGSTGDSVKPVVAIRAIRIPGTSLCPEGKGLDLEAWHLARPPLVAILAEGDARYRPGDASAPKN